MRKIERGIPQIKETKAMGEYEGGRGVWTSTAAILVLFILLIIITKASWV